MTDSLSPTMLAFYLSMAVLSAVEALPLNSRAIVVRNPGIWPDASSTDYLGLVAIAVIIPVLVIGLLMYLYRRKHGRYPTFARKRIINEPTPAAATPRRSRRRRDGGVWRPGQPDEGLPGYTIQAKDGEMSLGVGRKRTDDEEYEMQEHIDRTSGESGEQAQVGGRDSRQPSFTSVASASGDGGELASRPSNTTTKPSESLPPYIPPPSPALVAGSVFGRVGSRNSVTSTRRGSFPRVALPPPGRRSSRAE